MHIDVTRQAVKGAMMNMKGGASDDTVDLASTKMIRNQRMDLGEDHRIGIAKMTTENANQGGAVIVPIDRTEKKIKIDTASAEAAESIQVRWKSE